MIEPGTKLDELIHELIFNKCAHDIQYLPESVVVEERKEEYISEWGQEPPEGFIEDEVSLEYITDCRPPTYCVKCGERVGRGYGAPSYSRNISAAMIVFNWLFNHGIVRLSNGDGDSYDCDFISNNFKSSHISIDKFEWEGTNSQAWAYVICLTAVGTIDS